MNVNNRSVFITGGGSGLGAAIARHLARQGWRVALAGRNQTRLENAATDLKKMGTPAQIFSLDVADAAAVEVAINEFRPDALVCCAAILGRGDVGGDLTPELFAEVMSINVSGTFNACAAVMKLWKQHGIKGDIVNISSLGGIRGMQKFSGFSAYATSKHAIVGLTEALAIDGRAHGIRVNAVAPGTVRTAMTEELGLQPKTQPDQLAPTVAFLLDRTQSEPISGTTMEVHCNDD
jgi:NAD(P)-dependent dehydrogenase (short-subunit alcohol dehydrogenase family)